MLDVVLRHQFPTLLVFFAHLRRHGCPVRVDSERLLSDPGYRPASRHFGSRPGCVAGRNEAAAAQTRRRCSSAIPISQGFGSFFGSGTGNTLNTGRFFIGLKPRDERTSNALDVINAAAAATRQGGGRHAVPAAVPGHHRGRAHLARPVPIYACRTPSIEELNTWAPKMLDKLKTLPELAEVSTDLLANAPQLKVAHQPRCGRALRDSASAYRRYPQRCFRPAPGGAIFHADEFLFHRARSTARLAEVDLPALDQIYVKAPPAGSPCRCPPW